MQAQGKTLKASTGCDPEGATDEEAGTDSGQVGWSVSLRLRFHRLCLTKQQMPHILHAAPKDFLWQAAKDRDGGERKAPFLHRIKEIQQPWQTELSSPTVGGKVHE